MSARNGPPTARSRPAGNGTATVQNIENIDRARYDENKGNADGPAAGCDARDAGMALAADAADPDWKASVREAVDRLAARDFPFTAEDVRELGVGEPESPAAWGACFPAACRAAGAHVVGYRPAARPAAHYRILAVWQRVGS